MDTSPTSFKFVSCISYYVLMNVLLIIVTSLYNKHTLIYLYKPFFTPLDYFEKFSFLNAIYSTRQGKYMFLNAMFLNAITFALFKTLFGMKCLLTTFILHKHIQKKT